MTDNTLYKLFLFICIILCTSNQILAQSFNNYDGNYLIENYYPEYYNGLPQTSGIVVNNNGEIFYGTISGLYSYNGNSYTKYDLPTAMVNDIGIDSLGTIYICQDNSFGKIQTKSNGKIIYKEILSNKTNNIDEFQPLKLVLYNNKCYLRCKNKKLIIINLEKDTNQVYIKPQKQEIQNIFTFNNKPHIQLKNRGIYVIKQDNTLSKSKILDTIKHLQIISTINISNNKHYIFTRKSGIFLLQNDIITPLNYNSSNYIKKNILNSTKVCYTGDTNIFLSTDNGGLMILDKQAKIQSLITDKNGLQSECIETIDFDKSGNIWAALSSGIAKIEYNSNLSYFDENDGLLGMVVSQVFFNNTIYCGTTNGLFFAQYDSLWITKKKHPISFKPVSKKYEFVNTRQLAVINNQLYAVSGGKIFRIKKNHDVEIVSNIPHPLCIYKVPNDNKVFIGTIGNIFYIEYPDKPFWQNPIKIKGINTYVRCFNQIGNDIWATSFSNGIFKINTKKKQTVFTQYDTTKGLPANSRLKVFEFENNTYCKTKNSIYKYNSNKNIFEIDTSFHLPNNQFFTITDIYNYTNNSLLAIESAQKLAQIKSYANQKKWINAQYNRIPKMTIMSITIDSNNSKLYFGGSKGLYLYKQKQLKSDSITILPIISKIILNKDSILHFNIIKNNKTNKYIINHKHNSIRFEFALPYFKLEKHNTYKYFLENFDQTWSEYSENSFKEYTNLPAGTYTFKLIGKNIYGEESNITSFTFTVLAPWYFTWLAFLGYSVMFVFIIIILIKINSARLKRANEKLEKTILDRTQEIRIKNEEILQQKEELQQQSEQLKKANIELSKLSIVASETENAVLITDANGNLEWINQGFIKLYGFTLEEIIAKHGKNLIKSSSYNNIQNAFEQCINEKKSVKYISENKNKLGKKLWIQTTLTPIIINNQIEKLVAIDTDVSKLKETEKDLKHKNKLITDSIQYAKRIQKAIMPSEETLSALFKEILIFFKPKDIVSGDFLWYYKHKQTIWVAAADCTGHGVPGAFMSLIGINLLNQIVAKNHNINAAEILNELRKQLLSRLELNNSEKLFDGMDISFVKIDKTNKTIDFAGAYNPLYLFRKNQLTEIKGNRFPIGRYYTDKIIPFKNNTIQYQTNDIIYMFSDGYYDQLNNNSEEKYLSFRFKKLLQKINTLPFEERKPKLQNELDTWRGNSPQNDDIIIVGINLE